MQVYLDGYLEMFHLAPLILGWLVAYPRSMRVHLVRCLEMLSVTSRLPVLVVVFLDVPQIRWAYTYHLIGACLVWPLPSVRNRRMSGVRMAWVCRLLCVRNEL